MDYCPICSFAFDWQTWEISVSHIVKISSQTLWLFPFTLQRRFSENLEFSVCWGVLSLTRSLCQKESSHVYKLIIITVPAVLPTFRLSCGVYPEGQFVFIL